MESGAIGAVVEKKTGIVKMNKVLTAIHKCETMEELILDSLVKTLRKLPIKV